MCCSNKGASLVSFRTGSPERPIIPFSCSNGSISFTAALQLLNLSFVSLKNRFPAVHFPFLLHFKCHGNHQKIPNVFCSSHVRSNGSFGACV